MKTIALIGFALLTILLFALMQIAAASDDIQGKK